MVDKRVLLVTFGIGLTGLGLISGGNITSSYEHFDPMRIDNFKYISEFCTISDKQSPGVKVGNSGNRSIICDNTIISNQKKHIEKHIGDLFDTIDKASPAQQYFYRRKIKEILPLLTQKAVKTGLPEEKFKFTYTKFLLEDILLHFSYQDTVISVSLYDSTGSKKSLEQIRREIILKLIDQGFQDFIQDPYRSVGFSGHHITTDPNDWEDFSVQNSIQAYDDLDKFLENTLGSEEYIDNLDEEKNEVDKNISIKISPTEYTNRGSLNFFKSTDDLKALGYEVVSHRVRESYDEGYRRFNIQTAFDTLGSVRVILPGETISFLQGIQYDPRERQRYLYGKVILLDEEKYDYGGGLCGGSTALYQGIILNTGFEISMRNHTKWYTSLYTAVINGEKITMPGLDSTIYNPNLDLHFTNITTHPIILVNNYDGSYGGVEEVFTLADPKYRGDVTFLRSYPATFTMQKSQQEIENERKILQEKKLLLEGGLVNPVGSINTAGNTQQEDSVSTGSTGLTNNEITVSPTKTVTGRCYIWNINGEEVRRCYKEIF